MFIGKEGKMGSEFSNFDMFRHDLAKLVNKYSLENVANIPDYVIAAYMVNCFIALNKAMNDRNDFFSLGDPFENIWKGK